MQRIKVNQLFMLRTAYDLFKRKYWPLIKSLQTGLLLTTGLAGFVSARCPILEWQMLVGVTGSLFLAVSGSIEHVV
jgi:heme O synthase-like polyprenyltransferase